MTGSDIPVMLVDDNKYSWPSRNCSQAYLALNAAHSTSKMNINKNCVWILFELWVHVCFFCAGVKLTQRTLPLLHLLHASSFLTFHSLFLLYTFIFYI